MAFLAQFVSVMTSISVSLLLPKILGVENYAYFQLLVFGITYIGLLHLGLSDGVYLKYGGYDFTDLNCQKLGVFFWTMLLWLIGFSILGGALLPFFISDTERIFVWNMVFIYGVFANESWYLGYIFQATNNTKWYSISILIFKLIVLSIYLLFYVQGQSNVEKYIKVYVLAQIISFIYCAYLGRNVVFGIKNSKSLFLHELVDTCKVGIVLTFSNISNALILGIGRVVVDRKWNLEYFGKISLSLSLTNFLMQFMQQISMVLFPALRQSSKKYQENLFDALNETVGIIICGFYIFYYPLAALLNLWLPNYYESFMYLALLLPICCYDGKVYILYNTYMKVMRKEKSILKYNVESCILSLILCTVFASVFNSIEAIVVAMVISICYRNFRFGYQLSAEKKRFLKAFMMETMLSVVFICLCGFLGKKFAFLIYLLIYIIVVRLKKNDFKRLKVATTMDSK